MADSRTIIYCIVIFIVDIIIGGIWYPREGHPKTTVKAFWLKMLASGIFLLNGFYAFFLSSNGFYSKLIVLALIAGIIGDALLSLDPFFKGENKKRNTIISTVVGAAIFLGGHIVYIIAFIKELKLREAFNLPVFIVSWVLILGTAITVKIVLKVELSNLAIPMLIYSMGLAAMGSMCICLAIFGLKGHIFQQIMMIIAPFMFMISDATLGLKFGDSHRFGKLPMRHTTLLTYYTAQMLFGFSIIYLG